MRQVTSEIVDYMNENEIVVNNTNYKLELLNFIAEGVLNDLNKEQFDDLLHEAMTVLLEGENFNVTWGSYITQKSWKIAWLLVL